jgi:OFA family oxalate/formate antiporter-like MFS transporter
VKNLGWRVTLSGLGINLALGILYSWSVVSKRIPAEWEWSDADKSWPFSLACLVFSLVMVPAGWMQDRIGPRLTATLGGLLVGLGMIFASFTTTPLGYIVGFGLLAGAGFGFGYASATPPAVKWFPRQRTGLIAGIVVSGFGLASVYTSPLTSWLVGKYGLATAVTLLGMLFLVVVVALAQLLKTPPLGYVHPASAPAPGGPKTKEEYHPWEMLRTWQFYLLWFVYACGAGAGLMIIAKLDPIVDLQAHMKRGFLLVAVLAIGNGAGRIIAGMMSDRIGRRATIVMCLVMQAGLMLLMSRMQPNTVLASIAFLALISALIGANYGANLSLFPAITKDYFGLKNFGMNYGLVFTAWGVGGFILPLIAGIVFDKAKTFELAYYLSAGSLIAAALVTLMLKPPRHFDHEAT